MHDQRQINNTIAFCTSVLLGSRLFVVLLFFFVVLFSLSCLQIRDSVRLTRGKVPARPQQDAIRAPRLQRSAVFQMWGLSCARVLKAL